jgi:hypothetical protein
MNQVRPMIELCKTICRKVPRTIARLGLFAALALVATACGKDEPLTVHPTTPAAAELVPAAQLKTYVYKRLLLLPPEGDVDIQDDVEAAVVREKGVDYYVTKLEKTLLAQGFEVIAPEIVARAKTQTKGEKHTAAEKAMIMGRETEADAVLMLQAVRVAADAKFFDGKDYREVAPNLRRKDKKGDGYHHAQTEDCLYRLPYYEVRIEAKMIDAGSGDVLWVGSGRQSTLDVLRESWVATLDKRCRIEEQGPYNFGDFLAAEESLDAMVATLLERMIRPMKSDALAGTPIVRKPAKKDKEEKKPKARKKPTKTNTAIVSSRRANLRAGPGRRNQRMRAVPRKTKVTVIEVMGEWYKVKLQDGTIGWLHESTIIVSE